MDPITGAATTLYRCGATATTPAVSAEPVNDLPGVGGGGSGWPGQLAGIGVDHAGGLVLLDRKAGAVFVLDGAGLTPPRNWVAAKWAPTRELNQPAPRWVTVRARVTAQR